MRIDRKHAVAEEDVDRRSQRTCPLLEASRWRWTRGEKWKKNERRNRKPTDYGGMGEGMNVSAE